MATFCWLRSDEVPKDASRKGTEGCYEASKDVLMHPRMLRGAEGRYEMSEDALGEATSKNALCGTLENVLFKLTKFLRFPINMKHL